MKLTLKKKKKNKRMPRVVFSHQFSRNYLLFLRLRVRTEGLILCVCRQHSLLYDNAVTENKRCFIISKTMK